MWDGRNGWLAALVLLALSPRARADSALGPGTRPAPECSGCCYSPCHYWAPGLYRFWADLFGPKMNQYAPNRYPQIPPTYRIIRFPGPCAAPAAPLRPALGRGDQGGTGGGHPREVEPPDAP